MIKYCSAVCRRTHLLGKLLALLDSNETRGHDNQYDQHVGNGTQYLFAPVHSHILPQNVPWFIPALLHLELVGLPLPLLLELLFLLQVGIVAAALAPGFGLAMLLQHLLGTSLHVEGDLGEHVGEVVHVKPRGFDLVTRLRALHEPVLGLLSRRVVVGATHVGEDLLGT